VIKGSALTNKNVDKLLEAILAIAEINEYKANPNRLATGVIVESNIDLGLGPVATILIKNGTLAKSDFMIAGSSYGRVRIMLDENAKELMLAYPSTPVKIIGLNEPPLAGDQFVVSTNEQDIKEIAKKIKFHNTAILRQIESTNRINLDNSGKYLNIVLKTDVHGSLEAISNMLVNTQLEKIKINLMRRNIGGITESDVQLAKASNAIIVGFNVKPTKPIKTIADNQKVKIYFYDIIYKLQEDIQAMLESKLDPIYEEKETGEAIIQHL
jgi:translation initiation factor IF-2